MTSDKSWISPHTSNFDKFLLLLRNPQGSLWRIYLATLDLFSHLISLVNVEDKPRGLAEDEDDHDGEEEGRHGIVPPVAGAQGVVMGGVARIQ